MITLKALYLSDKQIDIYNAIQEKTLIVACTGRQVGKTEIAIITAISWLIKGNEYDTPYCYFLPTIKQCKKVYDDIVSRLGILIQKGMLKCNRTDLTIIYKNTTLRFLSAESGDSIRGYTFHSIIIDEACFINDDVFNSVILPTVTVSLSNDIGKMLIVSTPKTKNWFFNMVTNPSFEKDECYITRFTSEEGGLISSKLLQSYRKSTPERVFNNEYMGEFIEEGDGLFRYKSCLTEQSIINEVKNNVIKNKHNVFAGVDWGIEDDYTVLTIINKDGYILETHKWKQIEWNKIIDSIVNIVRQYRCIVYAETNGIGNMPFKTLRERYSNTQAFTTTNKSKNDIIQKLIMDFEKNEIKIPNNKDLIKELDSFELSVTKFGNITYSARQGFNDDMIMSLAIANHKRNSTGFMI